MPPIKKKCRQYDDVYIAYGFIANSNNPLLPQCLVCGAVLSNDSMKPSKLAFHLQSRHSMLRNKPIEYFTQLRDNVMTSSKTLKKYVVNRNNTAGVKASYKIAYLIAKQGRPHVIAEQLIKPAIIEAFKVANIENPSSIAASIPLSNDTISSRISDMAGDVLQLLVEDLKTTKFSLTIDDSTFGSECVVLAYVRYIKNENVCEEMLFMKTLISCTGEALCDVVETFLREHEISCDNISSICTDGAPSMIGREKGFATRLVKERNIFTMHCILHRENLAAKKIGNHDLQESLQTVVSAVNKIKSRALQNRLFQNACQDEHFHGLLYHTDVRWLSLGQCLTRFVCLFDTAVQFLQEKDAGLATALVSHKLKIFYLEGIFTHLNILNASLQESWMTVVKAKHLIKTFMNKLTIWKMNVTANNYSSFPKLEQETITSDIQTLVIQHLSFLHENFDFRFRDLLQLSVPPFVDAIYEMNMDNVMKQPQHLQMELCEVLADDRMLEMAKNNWVRAWLCHGSKYPLLSEVVRPFIINLPTSNLAETGFSRILHSYSKQRNRLCLHDNPDMRICLSNLEPRIDELATGKQAQGSH